MQATRSSMGFSEMLYKWNSHKRILYFKNDLGKFARYFVNCRLSCRFHHFQINVGKKLDVFGSLMTRQCNAIAAQRLRRTIQIMQLYSRIYNEQTIRKVVENFRRNLLHRHLSKRKPLFLLLGASVFSWENNHITDHELNGFVDDAERVRDYIDFSCQVARQIKNSICASSAYDINRNSYMSSWEKVIDKPQLQVWRRPFNDALYEYKVCGTFYDVPARAFYNVQMDLDYRKQWDRYAIKLDIVDRDKQSGSDVIHWVTHFPYPLYSRDYVYVRRSKWNESHKVMVVSSRAVNHPNCPVDNHYVRVTCYNSNMVIKPHSNFDEEGFDYVLTYHDDPQSNIPTFAYKWMASTGVPEFVDKLHKAAKVLYDQSKTRSRHMTQTTNDTRTPVAQYS